MEDRTQMLTLYSDQHHDHAPQVEYLHGKTISYAEQPQRIENIRTALEASGLVKLEKNIPALPRQALLKAADGGLVHFLENAGDFIHRVMDSPSTAYQTSADQQYMYPSVFPVRPFMDRLQHNARGSNGFYFFDTEAPVGKTTWNAVLASASLAYAGAEMILASHKSAYALCRPPGHHAGADFMGGYCYINNAAVAAHHLRQMGRVSIIDIDYHHGNGTQSIFWDVPEVQFISLHGSPDIEYPYYSGYADETGTHNTIINKPLPANTDTETYLAVLDSVIPQIQNFNSSSIVISLGFDTYEHDPLGTFNIIAEGYQQIARRIAALNLPTLLIQEGGYAVEELGNLAVHFLKGFLE